MRLPDLRTGVYRHYKNHFYLVLGYGHDANYEDRTTVHYLGLELNEAHTGPRLATCTAVSDDPEVDAWFDYVHSIDGSKCLHGITGTFFTTKRYPDQIAVVPRFEYVGPSWEG